MDYPELRRAIDVIKALRHPISGCKWDLKQTHESLLKYLIEESYEYIEAVNNKSSKEMEDELGDILLQVLLHSQIASETNSFDLESVAKNLSEKMIRRHPHVFKTSQEEITEEEIISNWAEIKKAEKGNKEETFFKSKDLNLPALSSSYKIGKKSKEVNFDWNNYKDVILKVEEELQEVKEELTETPNPKKVQEEIGDLLFSVAQLSRHLDVDPEEALREANKKFIDRFTKIEKKVKSQNKKVQDFSNEQLEKLWKEVKKLD